MTFCDIYKQHENKPTDNQVCLDCINRKLLLRSCKYLQLTAVVNCHALSALHDNMPVNLSSPSKAAYPANTIVNHHSITSRRVQNSQLQG